MIDKLNAQLIRKEYKRLKEDKHTHNEDWKKVMDDMQQYYKNI